MCDIQQKEDGKVIGCLATVGHVTANNVLYTEEALKRIAENFKASGKPMYGGIWDDTMRNATLMLSVADIAFEIPDIFFEDPHLKAVIKPLPTPRGKVLSELLELEKREPGTFSVGLAVAVDEKDMEKREGDVLEVKRCKLERVTFISRKDKA